MSLWVGWCVRVIDGSVVAVNIQRLDRPCAPIKEPSSVKLHTAFTWFSIGLNMIDESQSPLPYYCGSGVFARVYDLPADTIFNSVALTPCEFRQWNLDTRLAWIEACVV
jgi:hypothetical protein